MAQQEEQQNIIDLFKDNTLIIMDSNVWLDLYKLPQTAIKCIVDAIERNRSIFWIPKQVYIEFNRHIIKSRDEALNRYKEIKKTSCELLSNTKNEINQKFENLKRNNILDAVTIQGNFDNKIKDIISYLKECLNTLDNVYQEEISCISKEKDIIMELVESLHKESNTNGFTTIELLEIYEEGEIRYKYKVPPGYSDALKKEPRESENDFLLRKYGDLIIWKEILNKVRTTDTNLLFIQNEKKSDWWELSVSTTKRISKVLVQEFQAMTAENSKFHMINFEQLLKLYGDELGLPAITVKDIVSKLKLENLVCDYLNRNKNNIIEPYIEEVYSEDERGYNLLKDESLFGGTVETVEDFEILNINIVESYFEYDRDWDIAYISADAEIECSAHVIEYVNKYVYHSGKCKLKIKCLITLDFSIDFSDLTVEAKDGYDITNYEISNEKLIQLNHDEFDIDVDVDEDIFRDR